VLKLDLSRGSKRFLDTLPPKQFRQVTNKIFSLMSDPSPTDSIQLRGSSAYRRADIGEYRIIYNVEKDCLNVYCVGKRNDAEIYKKLTK
jgi:mRNA interferase RelE/StbE